MPSVAELTSAIRHEQGLIDSWQAAIARREAVIGAKRLATDMYTRDLNRRIRSAEDRLAGLTNDYLRQEKVLPSALLIYTRQYQVVRGGFKIDLDTSDDGVYYSNPGPKILSGKSCWVRATIDDAHRGVAGETPQTHDLAWLRWEYDKTKFTQRDTVSPGGRDEYFVTYPLVIVRQFTAKATVTNAKFKLNVEVYRDVGDV